jgi:hypothetical protein
MFLPHVSSIFLKKKAVQKTFGPHCVISRFYPVLFYIITHKQNLTEIIYICIIIEWW